MKSQRKSSRKQTPPTHDGQTAPSLCDAVKRGDLRRVTQLIDRGADVNLGPAQGVGVNRCPIYVACETDHANIGALLIERGANINLPIVGIQGTPTPLVLAIVEKNGAAAQRLIDLHADVNLVSHSRQPVIS